MGLATSKISQDAPINELVGLLSDFAPDQLLDLKQHYPTYGTLLKPGLTLGTRAVKDEVLELKVRSEVCRLGLEVIIKKAESLLSRIKAKLKLLNNVQLVSQIVVTISGASILIFLQEQHGDPFKLLIGGLTLAAGLLSLYVQHKSGTLAFGENSLSKVFNDLADYKLKAEHFLKELSILEKLNFKASEEASLKIINQSNDISLQMKKIIEKI